MQSELLAYPGEQIGQRKQRGCVEAVSKGQGVGADEGPQKEGVLCHVAREDLTVHGAVTEATHERMRERSVGAITSLLSAHNRVDCPVSRRWRFSTICGSNDEFTSRGTSMIDRAGLGQHGLGPDAVAGVAAATPDRFMLVVPEMFGHLGVQRRLQHVSSSTG